MKTALESGPLAGNVAERRLDARYRFSTPVTVHGNGPPRLGMSIEISQSGMSAMMSGMLTIGDTVQVEHIVEGAITARIHRQTGKVYAFEFVSLTPHQRQRILDICQVRPLYDSRSLEI